MIVDIASHILPPGHFQRLLDTAGSGFYLEKRIRSIPELWDLEARFRVMEPFGDLDYRQVLSVANPPIESFCTNGESAVLCRALNDELRLLVDDHPARFVSAFGYVPVDDQEAAVEELDHLVELGLPGFEIYTHVAGRPLDHANVLPILEQAFERDLCVLLHPARGPERSDYASEIRSEYELWQILGWPYDTTVAMVRLVLSGIFDRHPDAVVIAHHLGGMVPFFQSRLRHGLDQLGSRTDGDEYAHALDPEAGHPVDRLRRMHCDTAVNDSAAVDCAARFFGPERMLFGSDMPFDSVGGRIYIRSALEAIDASGLAPEEKRAVLEGNARALLGLGNPG